MHASRFNVRIREKGVGLSNALLVDSLLERGQHGFDGNAGACEHRHPAQDLGILVHAGFGRFNDAHALPRGINVDLKIDITDSELEMPVEVLTHQEGAPTPHPDPVG